MRLEDVLLFKGNDIQQYADTIQKKEKIEKTLRRLNDKAYDLKDAIEVLEGDEKQYLKIEQYEAIKKKIAKKEHELYLLNEYIKNNQF